MRPPVTSNNSYINSDEFPCSWGTFSTVALLIVLLPSDSQVSVRDVAEAYRIAPVTPSQWPGLVICNDFGLAFQREQAMTCLRGRHIPGLLHWSFG